ncbi:MAG: hypothetical protein QOG68_2663, partial [Solirubrobacteraceae bacterium]|nr:hypothetical protein [Solirubrobacteraceae bacterium]
AGELVKGHAIVAAELGLARYQGKAVRDERLFDGAWAKPRRAEHLLVRLALTGELWRRAGAGHVTLYRAAATDGVLEPGRRGAFVSATFSRDVAEEHFAGGPTTRAAVIVRDRIAVERLLMTFWETPAMNAHYQEAEAIVLGFPEIAF